MQIFQSAIFYGLLMIVAGLGIPIMASLNSGLASKLNNPMLATIILFSVASISAILLFTISGKPLPPINKQSIPPIYYLGGFFITFYVMTVSSFAVKLGVGVSISLVLLGQLISVTIIDHFALLGMPKFNFTFQRLIGIVLIVVGIVLISRR